MRAASGEDMDGNWTSLIMHGPSKGLHALQAMRPGSDGPLRLPSPPLLNRGALPGRGKPFILLLPFMPSTPLMDRELVHQSRFNFWRWCSLCTASMQHFSFQSIHDKNGMLSGHRLPGNQQQTNIALMTHLLADSNRYRCACFVH